MNLLAILMGYLKLLLRWKRISQIAYFPCRIEQSPDTNKDELDSAEDTDGGKIDNEEVNIRVQGVPSAH